MNISFIIPAFNEEKLIAQTIDAIAAAARECGSDIAAHEILVVNDASTDRTAEIARQHAARVIDVHKRHIAAVRNAGARAAVGDVFIFVDADTLVPAETLRRAIKALQTGAIGGGAAVQFDDVSLPARIVGRALIEVFCLLRLAAGCFIFCRREAFEAVGGFDERFFASEEVWISRALRHHGRFVMVRHPVITSGRKLRHYGLARLLWKMFTLGVRGPKAVQKREGLEIWYEARRE